MEPKQQIEQLTRELEHAGYLYYVLDNPEMSDYDYDHKLRQLEELEAQYPQYASPLSPTRRVGGQALSEFVKVRHAVPLESLQDVFSFDELRHVGMVMARGQLTGHPRFKRRPEVEAQLDRFLTDESGAAAR